MSDNHNESALRFERVTLSFGDAPVLCDVSFDMLAGETRILFGAAGSGKTVLLKAALGLLKPVSGHIYVFGTDITGLSEQELFVVRSKMGVLFQEGGLFDSLNIEENVSYPLLHRKGGSRVPPGEVRPKVEEALRFVELEQTLEKFPNELSGGMRRRVGIARAVVAEPPLLLYDSPTAGLDPITANTIIALIVKERDLKNTATVMATHRYQDGTLLANFRYNPETAQLDLARTNGHAVDLHTKFMVLNEGRLVFEGTQAELEASTDSYVMKFVKR